jgi:hypothetical protein
MLVLATGGMTVSVSQFGYSLAPVSLWLLVTVG